MNQDARSCIEYGYEFVFQGKACLVHWGYDEDCLDVDLRPFTIHIMFDLFLLEPLVVLGTWLMRLGSSKHDLKSIPTRCRIQLNEVLDETNGKYRVKFEAATIIGEQPHTNRSLSMRRVVRIAKRWNHKQ